MPTVEMGRCLLMWQSESLQNASVAIVYTFEIHYKTIQKYYGLQWVTSDHCFEMHGMILLVLNLELQSFT